MSAFVFWQRCITPHSIPIAIALKDRGHEVRVVAYEGMGEEREALGWTHPVPRELEVVILDKNSRRERIHELVDPKAIHILEGLPRSGLLHLVQRCLAERHVCFGSMMEQVDDRGLLGVVKRAEYSFRLRSAVAPSFILAIGSKAVPWYVDKSGGRQRVYPFCYFLDAQTRGPELKREGPMSLGFVGRMSPGKRLDLLITALSKLAVDEEFSLVCIGTGEDEAALKKMAIEKLGSHRVEWLEGMPRELVIERMQELDYLVLPSDYDGWGAVVSEALMAGVSAICSDACGASVAMRFAARSYVFESGSVDGLASILSKVLKVGKVSEAKRGELARWAQCLAAPAGALYLENIAAHLESPGGEAPIVPWEQ